MAFNPQPVSKRDTYINMIVYGDPGAGKTALAASSPNGLILDADLGVEAAASLGRDVDSHVCEDYNDLTEAYNYFRSGPGCDEYDWVWLDSGTIFQEKALHDQIMVDLVAQQPHRNEFVPDMREYLINQNHLSKLIRHFCGLPINFGVTAYAEAYDIGEDVKVFMPMFQGGKGTYSTKICGYVNVIAYLGTQKAKEKDGGFQNRLLTRRAGRYYAKDRFDALDPVIDNPDMVSITETIQKSLAN